MEYSYLSQSLIGRFCPSLLLVGSVSGSYWSVLSQSLIGRLRSPPLLVGSYPQLLEIGGDVLTVSVHWHIVELTLLLHITD